MGEREGEREKERVRERGFRLNGEGTKIVLSLQEKMTMTISKLAPF